MDAMLLLGGTACGDHSGQGGLCLLTDFAVYLSDLVDAEIGVLKSLITIIYFSFQFC